MMFNVSDFILDHPCLFIGTLGLAVIGFLGIRAVQWVLIKFGIIEKVDSAASKILKEAPVKKDVDLKDKWWTVVTDTDEYKNFKANWRSLAEKSARSNEAEKLKKQYQQTEIGKKEIKETDRHLGLVYNVPASFSFWMKGVAFLASYLTAKKNIQGLFVCRKIENIGSKIEEMKSAPVGKKIAVIVGVSQSYPHYPQHKMAVLIEKKEDRLDIILADPMPEGDNRDINPKQLLHEKDIVMLGYVDYNAKEIVLRHVYKACRNNGIQARFYHSTVRRERALGCEVYALQDALAFLRDPKFMEKLRIGEPRVSIDENYTINEITALPPECLIGTQSSTLLEGYRSEGIDFKIALPGRVKSLQTYLDNHTVMVNEKAQNHYMTKKVYIYMKFLIQSLQTLKEEDVNEIANRCLI